MADPIDFEEAGAKARKRRRDIATNWPAPIAEAGLYGHAGEFVRLIESETEADRNAILIQFLIAFGNLCGRKFYIRAGRVPHFMNEFAVVVGDTSRARKGTSWAEVDYFFEKVAPQWTEKCITSGLSTGEGLIHHLRDPSKDYSIEPTGKNAGSGGHTRNEDQGISDKRLLVQESEFAQVLKVAAREGATLSTVVRQAWDAKTLRVLTKNFPLTATGPHVSILGHITQADLTHLLASIEMANGFANRFLWVCATRARKLPRGGILPDVALNELAVRVWQAAEVAQVEAELDFDDAALKAWSKAYDRLTEPKPGQFGDVIARSDPHVLRLACIFTTLDKSRMIRIEHLNAALAVWDYCQRSAHYIFGERLNDLDANKILAALRRTPLGLSLTEIHALFSHNLSARRIDEIRDTLLDALLIRAETTPTRGRPEERWFALEGNADADR
jgi:hypothetical protein